MRFLRWLRALLGAFWRWLTRPFRKPQPYTQVISLRRQFKKGLQRNNPSLRSGRQWRKFRKSAKRAGLFDYHAMPRMYVRGS